MWVKKTFKYLEPLWTGEDGKISVKSCLSIYFSYKLIENLDYGIQKWAADRSLEGLSSSLFILAGLIAALLGITAWTNMTAKKIDTEASLPPNTIVTVEKAETVTANPPNGGGITNTETEKTTSTSSVPDSTPDEKLQ